MNWSLPTAIAFIQTRIGRGYNNRKENQNEAVPATRRVGC